MCHLGVGELVGWSNYGSGENVGRIIDFSGDNALLACVDFDDAGNEFCTGEYGKAHVNLLRDVPCPAEILVRCAVEREIEYAKKRLPLAGITSGGYVPGIREVSSRLFCEA